MNIDALLAVAPTGVHYHWVYQTEPVLMEPWLGYVSHKGHIIASARAVTAQGTVSPLRDALVRMQAPEANSPEDSGDWPGYPMPPDESL